MKKERTQPVPSDDLRNAYANGRLIPWVGAGLSSAILGKDGADRLPGFRAIIQHLASEGRNSGLIDEVAFSEIEGALSRSDFALAAKLARSKVPPTKFGSVMWQRLSTVRPRFSQHHLMLNLMRFPAYLTTNYDWVLDDIVRPRPIVLDYRDHHNLLQLLEDDLKLPGASPFIFKLNGNLSSPSSIVLGRAEEIGLYDHEHELGRELRKTLKALMRSYSLLFLGYSFDAPGYRKMIIEIGDELGADCQPHFAVLPSQEIGLIPDLRALCRNANITLFPFDLDPSTKDGDNYRGLWQFLSQIPEPSATTDFSPEPNSVVRSFYLVKQRASYLEMQLGFEHQTTGFRFLTPTLTNAIATPEFIQSKTPATLKKFDGKEGIADWSQWKDTIISLMEARSTNFGQRMRAGAEARILCFEADTVAAINKAAKERDDLTLARYRLCLDQYDVQHHDIEVRFMADTEASRSLMSFASLIRLNPNRTTDVGVAYASQATTSEFDAHVFEMNTEFSRDMLVTFESEWARSLSLDESMDKLRTALALAEQRLSR